MYLGFALAVSPGLCLRSPNLPKKERVHRTRLQHRRNHDTWIELFKGPRLLTDSELPYDGAIALDVLVFEVVEHVPPLAYQF